MFVNSRALNRTAKSPKYEGIFAVSPIPCGYCQPILLSQHSTAYTPIVAWRSIVSVLYWSRFPTFSKYFGIICLVQQGDTDDMRMFSSGSNFSVDAACAILWMCRIIFFGNVGIIVSNKELNKRNHVSVRRNGPFDDALRLLSVHCKRWVLPVLKEAFETDIVGDEQIEPIENENIMVHVFGSARRNPHLRESQFLVTGRDGEKRRYQLECIANDDWTVAFARDFGGIIGPKTTIAVLETAVLCLRISDNTPDEYQIEVVE